MRLIAIYLPQYYPTEINDKWYGKGFTEWTNVASAKPLFRGHYEPHVPSDLGFYDLRVPEVRRQQAKMAQEAGIEAFCYWTYWFGNGTKALDMPIWEVYKDKEITFPFSLAWANHSWEKKQWDKNGSNALILKQEYLGREDYTNFFYTMLPLFKDPRYLRVDNKLFFIIYDALVNVEQLTDFVNCWRELARKENLGDFFFAAKDSDGRFKKAILDMGIDAVYEDNPFSIHHNLSPFKKVALKIGRDVFKRPTVFKYKDAIKYMIADECTSEDTFPSVYPNWDHSPRSGANAIILKDCEPKYFKRALEMAKEVVSKKRPERQLVILKSWNEWGEGNHLEPDLKYGTGYLDAIKEVTGK